MLAVLDTRETARNKTSPCPNSVHILVWKTAKQISTYSGKCYKENKWSDVQGLPEDGS